MVRPVGILVALLFALTPWTRARARVAAPAAGTGDSARGAVVRRPAVHPKDEEGFVHAISRARAPRPLGLDRA